MSFVVARFTFVYETAILAARTGCDDEPDAYRSVAAAHPQYTLVYVVNPDADGEIGVFEVRGHNFGLASAILAPDAALRSLFALPQLRHDVELQPPVEGVGICARRGERERQGVSIR